MNKIKQPVLKYLSSQSLIIMTTIGLSVKW